MPQMQDEAGNVWEVDAQGNVLGLISQANQAPADPAFQYAGQKAAADAQKASADATITRAEVPYAPQVAQANAQEAAANARAADASVRKAEFDLQKAQLDAAQGKDPEAAVKAAKSILRLLDKPGGVSSQFERNFKNQGVLGTLNEYNPFRAANNTFDADAAFIKPAAKKLARAQGEGSQSEKEAADYNALVPGSSKRDAENERLITNLREEAISTLQEHGAEVPKFAQQQAAQEDDDDEPIVAASFEKYLTDLDKSNNAKIESAFDRGASLSELLKLRDELGVQPYDAAGLANVRKWINARDTGKFGKEYGYKPYSRKDNAFSATPTGQRTKAQEVLGNIAESPLGTFGAASLDAATFGNLANISGALGADADLVRKAQDYTRDKNPLSALAGDVTGALAGTGAIGAVGRAGAKQLGGQALLGGGKRGLFGRGVATDATYGGLYGQSTDGDALTGALAGTIGSVGGQGVAKAGGTLLRGGGDTAALELSRKGIPLTTGQTLGGVFKGVEDRLAGYPFVGDVINARRGEGLESYNRQALNEATAPIGAQVDDIGAAGIDQARDLTSEAYGNALSGRSLAPDDIFQAESKAANQLGSQVPKFGEDFQQLVQNRIAPIAGESDNIDGKQFQQLLRTLDGYERQYGQIARGGINTPPAPTAEGVQDAFGGLGDAVRGLAGRQAPDALPALNAANSSWRDIKILEDAVGRARNGTRSGEVELFTPSQLNDASTSYAKRFTGRSATENRPFYDLATLGQKVLPSTIPDSGTAGRIALAGLGAGAGGLGGAGGYAVDGAEGAQTGALSGLGAVATLGMFGSRGGQRLLNSMITKRPDSFKALAQRFEDSGVLFGSGGAGLLLANQ